MTIDTALQICFANFYMCPSLDLAAARLDEWVKALVSEMQNVYYIVTIMILIAFNN